MASLARPGGNITGIATVRSEVVGKQLELLKEIVPRISSLTVLWNSANLDNRRQWKELQPAAVSLGLKLHSVEVHRPAEIEKALDAVARQRGDALFVINDAPLFAGRKRIAEFALRSRLPTAFATRESAEDGGLMSYGPSFSDLWIRMGAIVDKILFDSGSADLSAEGKKLGVR